MNTVAGRVILALLSLIVLSPLDAAAAQHSDPAPMLGVLISGSRVTHSSFVGGLERGLKDRGYIEGQNIVIERRYAEGKVEKLPELAAELARLNPHVLFAGGDQAIRAVRDVPGRRAPIVMVACDAIASGFVTNLARPGGDITGVSCITAEVSAKRVEIMRELIPALERIGVLFNPTDPSKRREIKLVEEAIQRLGIGMEVFHLGTADDIRPVFADAEQQGVTALVHLFDSGIFSKRAEVARVAAEHRLAIMFSFKQFVDAGGLISFGPSLSAMWERAASHVAKILRGANAGDLPVEQPTKFELAINLKTARALGLTIPPSLLLRADQVIE